MSVELNNRRKCTECVHCDYRRNYNCQKAYRLHNVVMSVYKHFNCQHFEPRYNAESQTTNRQQLKCERAGDGAMQGASYAAQVSACHVAGCSE